MIKIYLDSEERLALNGDSVATEADYEGELELYASGRYSNSILQILRPGQEIFLYEGQYWLDDDLSLLVPDD